MSRFTQVPSPSRATPTWILWVLSHWNEMLMNIPVLRLLQIKPTLIPNPWLLCKLAQSMSSFCEKASKVLGYRSRPLRDIIDNNGRSLIESKTLNLKEAGGELKKTV